MNLNSLTPAKIATNKYLKHIIRFLGIPSQLRAQCWLLLALTPHRATKLETRTVDDIFEHKIAKAFGPSGLPRTIARPPTFGASKISIAEHCLKDTPESLSALYRVLLLLQESLSADNRQLVQLPDVVAFLLHYHDEPEAFYTAYAMIDSPEKYFIVPDAEVFDRLIKSLLPKIWSRTSSLCPITIVILCQRIHRTLRSVGCTLP